MSATRWARGTAALGLMVAGLAVTLPAQAAPLRSAARTTVAGGRPSWLNGAAKAAAIASAPTGVTVRVVLAPRGGIAALKAAVDAVSDPHSPSYGQFLTTAQYRAAFAPDAATVAAARAWLVGAGMQVTRVDPSSRWIAATGSVAAAQAAFGTTLGVYQHGTQVVLAPEGDASVPASLGTAVLAVSGLDTTQHAMRPAVAPDSVPGPFPPPAGFHNAPPCSAFFGQLQARFEADGTTALPRFDGRFLDYAPCGYTPSQYRSAFEGPTSLDGSGVTVAITDAYAAATIREDANQYATRQGDAPFAPGQFHQYVHNRYTHTQLCDPLGWEGEETLDVEAVHGMAPGARVLYYGAKSCLDADFLDTLAQVVDDNRASIVTNSWGDTEEILTPDLALAYDQIFLQGAMQGIGFMFSSGDAGDGHLDNGQINADYPASDPYVTTVGGTATGISKTGHLDFQTGWGTEKYVLSPDGSSWVPYADDPFTSGSGGGISKVFEKPNYQRGVVDHTGGMRAYPDVAMDGDPATGMLVGETQVFPNKGTVYDEYRIGGTSLSSPLMAGIQALTSQHAGRRLGFANPAIYEQVRSGAGTFTDVLPLASRDGIVRADYNNRVNPSDGITYSVRLFDADSSLFTAPGWDDVTGVGTPNPAYLTSR